MSHVERAVGYVRERGFARTTDLAKLLGMIPGDVDLLLAGKSDFVTCDVQVGDSKLKEYRLSTAPAHNLRAGTPIPPTPPRQASVAPTPIAHVPTAPDRGAPKEKPMSESKSVTERVLEVLKGEAELHVDEIAKRAKTTKNSLSTMIGKIKGVRRTRRGFYALAGNQMLKAQPRQHVVLASGGELGRRKTAQAKPNGSPYAAALADLNGKREALMAEVAKLDRAIEAVGALA